jgi:hypothetical protein
MPIWAWRNPLACTTSHPFCAPAKPRPTPAPRSAVNGFDDRVVERSWGSTVRQVFGDRREILGHLAHAVTQGFGCARPARTPGPGG